MIKKRWNSKKNARIAQLVEHDLAKVGVAGSNPVSRSEESEKEHSCSFFIRQTGCSDGGMVDTPDLKSCACMGVRVQVPLRVQKPEWETERERCSELWFFSSLLSRSFGTHTHSRSSRFYKDGFNWIPQYILIGSTIQSFPEQKNNGWDLFSAVIFLLHFRFHSRSKFWSSQPLFFSARSRMRIMKVS